MDIDVEAITSGIVLIILGLVFIPLFAQLMKISPSVIGNLIWFPYSLIAIGVLALALGVLKLIGFIGIIGPGEI